MLMNHTFAKRRELSMDEIRRVAPSVFGEEAHHSRTAKYQHISTADILARLCAEDFFPVYAHQQRVRNPDKTEFTRHVLRFRHRSADFGTIDQVGDTFPELALMNSHDGSSTYKLLLGLFRLVCSNGMMTGDTFSGTVVRHKGDIQGAVIDGAYRVMNDTPKLACVLGEWRNLVLTPDQISEYNSGALKTIYGDKAPPLGNQLIMPRRAADSDPNLWLLFNRVQENAISGGLSYARTGGRRATGSTRAITGLTRDLEVNQALWDFTHKFAAEKLAA